MQVGEGILSLGMYLLTWLESMYLAGMSNIRYLTVKNNEREVGER